MTRIMRTPGPGGRLYTMAAAAAAAALAGTLAAAAAILAFGEPRAILYLALALMAGVAMLVHRAVRRAIAASVRRIDDLMRVQLSTIEALALAIDAKDPHARGHARRVQGCALELARRLGMGRRDIEGLRAAALLHDIGKLAIPDYLLHKPGKLSDIEYQKVKVHPGVAAEILASVDFPYPVVPAIRHHHERWDGTGYPDGLKGEAIPLAARVLAVADVFEALTSERVYRHRKSADEACALIEAWSGIQFDPAVVDALRRHLPVMVEALSAEPAAAERPAAADAAGGAAARPAASPGGKDPGGFGDALHHGVQTGAPVWIEREGDGTIVGRRAAVLSDISSAHREVYALYEIAQTLGSSLRLADLLDLVVTKIGQLIPYHTCVFYLLEDGGDMLSARFTSGAFAEDLRGRAVRPGDGITGWAAAQKSSRFSTSPELDLAGSTVDPRAFSTVAAFPLCHEGATLGVITLFFPKGVACLDDHIRMMEIVAKLAAGAVHNATVFAESQDSALRDELTGLPNSRYLRQVFEQEKVRSQQAGQPMALLEMDLDDFKTVNDRFGHHTGDRFLGEVARVLRSHLRERDILVRLSGDEFGAILPLTGFAQAALLAERLQHAVETFALRIEEGKAARSGLSVGIALYPQDSDTFEDLLMKADFNMYQNKSARKAARLDAPPNILPFPRRNPGQKG